MSILRLVLTRTSPSPTAHIFPTLRSCPLRTQLLRKSLPQQAPRRPFASSAPGSRAGRPTTTVSNPVASKPAAAGPGSSASAQQQHLPERLLIYQAGTGKIGFVAGLKITTIFVAAVFALVMEPAMLRSDTSLTDIGMACKFSPSHPLAIHKHSSHHLDTYLYQRQKANLAIPAVCALIPFAYVSYVSAPFVTHVFLRLPPHARQSRAFLERYVRSLPPTAQLEIGTLGLAGRPRATLVAAADLRPDPSRLGLVTHTRDVSALMARKKWYHYRPVSMFGLPAKEGKASSGGGGKSKNAAKDAWVYDMIRPMFGKTGR
ncbi:hypothetical protein CkaCkLH20_06795 [Colletotrichum karsti]|uniref:Uncharacterized protein n=1 Tax=Colletotrichum karsti TaxID=1095194 RepID=A0A9P6LJN7_9PEZI|nr:uncharacterized protein CkaCkLH20_06795 [Colletotrichum karsti]KAF9875863.1 hypothetical protein CkaCkLH20_06795 [Colletotrichum karsti]